ncbi:MAG: gamma-glutamylcyclotransferase family protein [Pyrinomonadaceae bacterium]
MEEAEHRRIDVFFYGLFMDEELLRAKGINARNGRMARVENFSLVIRERATLVPSRDQTVYGLVFSLTHRELDALYSEVSVSVYRPEAVSAKLADGRVIPALCFNLPFLPPAASIAEANVPYGSKLRELATRIGLPAEYVTSIQ